MNFKTISLIFILFQIVACDSKSDAEIGKQLTLNALNILLHGEPTDQAYQDLFLDTSKGIFENTDGGNDMVTVDDMLRIFIQSILILSTSRRPDLMPRDFHTRNEAYGAFIESINSLLDNLKSKGTDKVTLKDLRPLIKSMKSDDFWASIVQLKNEVDHEIELEALEKSEKTKTEL